jgi:glycosyltransferase involved in cell wall biosynthesis
LSVNSLRRVALVTNIPAPYRLPVYEIVAAHQGIDLCVFYCSGREPDREWDLQSTKFKQVFLEEKFITYRNKFIHCNPDVWAALRSYRPTVIVTTGFGPTFLLAFLYAKLNGLKHIPMTDGTDVTEATLSMWHRLVRRVVYRGSSAFIGASQGSFRLYASYGLDRRKTFQSHLCSNNDRYFLTEPETKRFDFVFSARFVAAKNPLFAMDVAMHVAKRLGRRTRLLLLGSGEEMAAMRAKADEIQACVEVEFAGFVKQAQLPAFYASARILLFPTQLDTWGVVANEACAAGVPVLVTPMAGVAHELVIHGENGYVLPLDLAAWTEACMQLLTDASLYDRFSAASRLRVKDYTYQHAAEGICAATASES